MWKQDISDPKLIQPAAKIKEFYAAIFPRLGLLQWKYILLQVAVVLLWEHTVSGHAGISSLPLMCRAAVIAHFSNYFYLCKSFSPCLLIIHLPVCLEPIPFPVMASPQGPLVKARPSQRGLPSKQPWRLFGPPSFSRLAGLEHSFPCVLRVWLYHPHNRVLGPHV